MFFHICILTAVLYRHMGLHRVAWTGAWRIDVVGPATKSSSIFLFPRKTRSWVPFNPRWHWPCIVYQLRLALGLRWSAILLSSRYIAIRGNLPLARLCPVRLRFHNSRHIDADFV